MIVQKESESRLEYLARVLYHMMNDTDAGYSTMEYDGTECDGACLAEDIMIELGLTTEDLYNEET